MPLAPWAGIDPGNLTLERVAERALGELVDPLDSRLGVRGINMANLDFADGHARRSLAGITGQGPEVDNLGGHSEAGGESRGRRIGREINGGGRESLYLYAGRNCAGWGWAAREAHVEFSPLPHG